MNAANTIHDLNCAVIVAHPDDETLWAGGTILLNPSNRWTIITTCRKYDPDRSSRFSSALKILNANGDMGDLDDGPEQVPLEKDQVEDVILSLLPDRNYDLIITHSTHGEYTRHLRHEEVADATISLIESDRLKTRKLWMFAYEDGQKKYLPRPIKYADKSVLLPREIWKRKHEIITEVYGFDKDSWEASATPMRESFWTFRSVFGIKEWINERSINK